MVSIPVLLGEVVEELNNRSVQFSEQVQPGMIGLIFSGNILYFLAMYLLWGRQIWILEDEALGFESSSVG